MTLTNTNTFSGNTSLLAGTLALTNPASNNLIPNSAVIQVGSGANLDVTGLNASKLTLASGQSLTGNGKVIGNIETIAPSGIILGSTITAGGLLTPGHLTITGDATLNGTLMADLAGLKQGVDYDWLEVGGITRLAGTVDVNLVGGFTPDSGARFYVLTSVGGILTAANFANVKFDFTHAPMIGGWQVLIEELGNDAGEALVLVASPEPATLVLLGGGLLALLRRRRRR